MNLTAEVLAEFAQAQQLGREPPMAAGGRLAQPYHETAAAAQLRRRAQEALAAWGVPCPVCGEPVYSTPGHKRRIYCSPRCRHRACENRHPGRGAAAAARYRERLGGDVVRARARERYRRHRERVCAQVRARYHERKAT